MEPADPLPVLAILGSSASAQSWASREMSLNSFAKDINISVFKPFSFCKSVIITRQVPLL